MRNRKREELTNKYYDLWQATLMNILVSNGINPIYLTKTDEIVRNAIKSADDIEYHHKKLMELRGA